MVFWVIGPAGVIGPLVNYVTLNMLCSTYRAQVVVD
jgi:hypothetical protein